MSCSDTTFLQARQCTFSPLLLAGSSYNTTFCDTANFYHPACAAGVMWAGTTSADKNDDKMECCPGYYCPKNFVCMFPCSKGALCPTGTLVASSYQCSPFNNSVDLPLTFTGNTVKCGGASTDFICPAGYYCPTTTESHICPAGHYCRQGSISPTPCVGFGSCAEGSGAPNADLVGVAVLIFVLAVVLIALKVTGIYRDKKHRRETQQRKAQQNVVFTLKSVAGRPSIRVRMVKWAQRAKARVAAKNTGDVAIAVKKETTSKMKNYQMLLSFDKLGLRLKSTGVNVLAGVTGDIKPGRVVAIMGPSGAGKTTLLSTLLGKAHYGRQTGHILINGQKKSINDFRDIVGFVPQEDIMHRTNTVEEVLRFSAKMRLPKESTPAQVEEVVRDVMNLLGLYDIRASLIGNEEMRGISGGQRKRVSIGMELVADPTMLFLDEPTSGLDSTTSMDVLTALKALSKRGVSVVTVLHQPRYEIFRMFDEVLLLGKGGLTVYLGPTDKAQPYFESLGFQLPDKMNPADFFMDVIAGQLPQTSGTPFHVSELPRMWDRHKMREAAIKQRKRNWGKLKMGVKLGLKTESFATPPLSPRLQETPRTDSPGIVSPRTDSPAGPEPTKPVSADGVMVELTHIPSKTEVEVKSDAPLDSARSVSSIIPAVVPADIPLSTPRNEASPSATPSATPLTTPRPVNASGSPAVAVKQSSSVAKKPFWKRNKKPRPTAEDRDPRIIAIDEDEHKKYCDNAYYHRRHPVGFFYQTYLVYVRSLIQQKRNLSVLLSDCVMVAACAILIGFLFRSKDLDSLDTVNFLITLSVGLTATQSSLKVFGAERVEFWREASSGMNRLSYFIGKNLAHMNFVVVAPAVYTLIYVPIRQPRADSATIYSILLMGQIACTGLGLFIAAFAAPKKAQLAGAMTALLLNMVGGTNPQIPQLNDMGPIGVFAYSISYSRYMTEALTAAETYQLPPVFDVMKAGINVQFTWVCTRDQLNWDLGLLGAVASVLYTLAFLGMIGLHRDKQR